MALKYYTLQSSETSQFEQHLRAILGLSLGSTELIHHAIMYNILGPKDFKGKYKPVTIPQQEGVFLKMYGKAESKLKRKLGHINIIDVDDSGNVENLLDKLEQIKKSLKLEQV